MSARKIWTDGACFPNPGCGGWGFTDLKGLEGHGGENPTTNQRMEIKAVIEALRACPEGPLLIISDSQYVIKGITEWIHGWNRRGWKNAKGEPVKNKDLRLELSELMVSGRPIKFKWVRGHNGDKGNERADALACRGKLEAKRGA